MKDIILVGGQGFLKECASYIQQDKTLNFKGFLGNSGFVPQIGRFQKYYLGNLEEYKIQENDYFLITVGNTDLRKQFYEMLKEKNAKFYNLFYKTDINPDIKIGEGNIFINCTLTVDIEIGNANLFNVSSIIGHDAVIGDYNFIAPCVNILGKTKIGSGNVIGTMSCLLPNSKIGNNNIISPGSYLYKGCKDNCYMQGNPALKIGNVGE